jgi:hypothetical protein
MPMQAEIEPALGPADEQQRRVWLRAEYVAHIFHYRMPETVATAAVSPIIPSPLTIKMAMLAALLRSNRIDEAQRLVGNLWCLRVLIQPPAGALTFKAFMRYVRMPATRDANRIDSVTGGTYRISPHVREYAFWDGPLTVFVETPDALHQVVEGALARVSYLGAKDSQVTCLDVAKAEPSEQLCARPAHAMADLERGGVVVRLAEWVGATPDLLRAIPGQRDKADYRNETYVLPGKLRTGSKSKVYRRDDSSDYSFAFLENG